MRTKIHTVGIALALSVFCWISCQEDEGLQQDEAWVILAINDQIQRRYVNSCFVQAGVQCWNAFGASIAGEPCTQRGGTDIVGYCPVENAIAACQVPSLKLEYVYYSGQITVEDARFVCTQTEGNVFSETYEPRAFF